MVSEVKLFGFRKPIIDQAMVCAGHGGLYSAATVMSANDYVFDLENLHCELNDRNAVQIRRVHQISDVSMDEQLSGHQTNDLVRWYSAVSASDPKELWGLPLRQLAKIIRLACSHAMRPGTIVF